MVRAEAAGRSPDPEETSMSLASSLLVLAPAAGHALAGVIPNPPPEDPAAGSNGITLLISYVKWGAVIACGISVVASGGLLALGSLSNRPDQADKGKRGLIWSLAGVVVAAIAIPVVNTVFSAAH
jgi:hypothetical protein